MTTMSGIGFDYGCESMMNMERQNNWMLGFGAVVRVAGLLSATISPASSFSQEHGTAAWHARPTCSDFAVRSYPNEDEIMACLRERNAELSDACRTAIEAE